MDPAQINALRTSIVITKFSYVIAASILFWDIALTFRVEVATVWKSKKTLGTTLFFINRYLAPASAILDLYAQVIHDPGISFCRNYYFVSTVLTATAVGTVEAILVMRTHALYRNRRLLYLLSFLAFISAGGMLVLWLIILTKYAQYGLAAKLGLSGCTVTCSSESRSMCVYLSIAFWSQFTFFETVVFAMTAWKSFVFYKRSQSTQARRLLTVLFIDGMVYYFIIIGAAGLNFFVWIFNPGSSSSAVGILKSLQATIASRLLLNIRGMLESATDETPSHGDGAQLTEYSRRGPYNLQVHVTSTVTSTVEQDTLELNTLRSQRRTKRYVCSRP
ncbi:hypothetical protein FA15DRAFT_669522 [Coprinopsis marcescibilis]|uniref:DUF6533 domain-containing protein n=1 Tax=Coprinopsis marcescibilis TaxID=230819 RepID=A0A5C3KWF1_COPMA|nr:hypothetical protein FA15DRAFT_669522 [Coprinopsis marcescibilis]